MTLRNGSDAILRVGLASVIISGGVSMEYMLPRGMGIGPRSCSQWGLRSSSLGDFFHKALSGLLKWSGCGLHLLPSALCPFSSQVRLPSWGRIRAVVAIGCWA